jgi:hypothetical protein
LLGVFQNLRRPWPSRTVAVRHHSQRFWQRRQTVAHRHGSLWRPRHPPARRHHRKLSVPNAERIFFIRHALRAGFTVEEIFNLTKLTAGFWCRLRRFWILRRNWRGSGTSRASIRAVEFIRLIAKSLESAECFSLFEPTQHPVQTAHRTVWIVLWLPAKLIHLDKQIAQSKKIRRVHSRCSALKRRFVTVKRDSARTRSTESQTSP